MDFFDECAKAYVSCITDRSSVTVTISAREANALVRRMSDSGLFVQLIGLHGRYHHTTNTEAVQWIKDFIKQDERFQLPMADQLVLPLRSNTNIEPLKNGALHEIALDSILVEQSQWFQTTEAAVTEIGAEKINFVSVSVDSFVPRSIISKYECHEPEPQQETPILSKPPIEFTSPPESSFQPTPPTTSDICSGDEGSNATPVAVIGMACRFPGAEDLEELWRLISAGKSAVQEVLKDRFNIAETWRNPKSPFWGNFLNDPFDFDHRFFAISSREAKSIDPQQRLWLQVVYEAMEFSGYYSLERDERCQKIGCFVGVGSVDYDDNVASDNATAFSALGTLRAFISGRVSHYFGWSGPSITYDTACSSSAVAIHSACKVRRSFSLLLITHTYQSGFWGFVKSNRSTSWL